MIEHVIDCQGTTRLGVGQARTSIRPLLLRHKAWIFLSEMIHGWPSLRRCLPRERSKACSSAHRVTAGGSESRTAKAAEHSLPDLCQKQRSMLFLMIVITGNAYGGFVREQKVAPLGKQKDALLALRLVCHSTFPSGFSLALRVGSIG